MPPSEMTGEMITVLAVIGVAVFLFLVEWVRVDVVAILVMVTLPMLGLVDPDQAFSGLASTAVVSIIAVIIMGRGLDHTGVINRVVGPLMKLAGTSETRIVVLLSGTVAVISSFMQNIGAAALFLPAIRRLGQKADIPLSRLLMPVGFAAILGGTVSLVGSSPLIMLNDLLRPFGLDPFNLFSVTPAGVLLVAAGIAYFVLLGRWVLPAREADGEDKPVDPAAHYEEVGRLFELYNPAEGAKGVKVGELCERHNVHPVALAAGAGRLRLMPPDWDMVIPTGAMLAVCGPEHRVREAARIHGFQVRPEIHHFKKELSSDLSGVVEAVVPPHSRFIGKTLAQIRPRHNFLVAPLAFSRAEKPRYDHLSDVTLAAGDAILMHGAWERFHYLRQRRDFIFTHALDQEALDPAKAGAAMACFLLATALVIFTSLPLAVCLMAGALGMVLTRVLSIEEAYRGVDWRTVFLLAGLIPLGLATQKSGAAAWLAAWLVQLMGAPPPLLFLFLVGAISTAFTLVISNVGAVVLLVPLVVDMAQTAGVDPRLAAMVLGLAASNSFILPTHQVNALYMGPGRYTSLDFVKAGLPLSLLYLVVLTLAAWLFY